MRKKLVVQLAAQLRIEMEKSDLDICYDKFKEMVEKEKLSSSEQFNVLFIAQLKKAKS